MENLLKKNFLLFLLLTNSFNVHTGQNEQTLYTLIINKQCVYTPLISPNKEMALVKTISTAPFIQQDYVNLDTTIKKLCSVILQEMNISLDQNDYKQLQQQYKQTIKFGTPYRKYLSICDKHVHRESLALIICVEKKKLTPQKN